MTRLFYARRPRHSPALLLALAAACGTDRASGPPPVSTIASSTPSSTAPGTPTTAPTHATPPCSRDDDHADWPAGRKLRLDIDPLETGAPATFTVTGAEPGERVVVHIGDVCGLDCPVEFDGACFQPADAVIIAEQVADATGRAEVDVVGDATWEERWLLFQATAPDSGAISQAFVDRSGSAATSWSSDPPEQIAPEWPSTKWIAPMTLRGLHAVDEDWILPVAPGRRVQITYEQESQDDDALMRVMHDGVDTDPSLWDGAADLYFPGPSTWYFLMRFDYGPGVYALDIETVPLDAPVDWYPDLDADGYGDPLGTPVSSAVPVSGASPDARDCDDADAASRPWGLEVCGDGIDQDCDGLDRACTEVPGVNGALDAGTRYRGGHLATLGYWITHGDLDGDGLPEVLAGGIVAGYDEIASAFDATRVDSDAELILSGWQAAAVGDVTGDGIDDAVASVSDEVQVFAGPIVAPVDETSSIATLPTVYHASDPEIGNLDGDGVGDVALMDSNGGTAALWLFYGPVVGSPTADTEIPMTTGGLTRPAVALGDADGDGLDDVWTQEVCLHLTPVAAAGAAPVGCVDDGTSDNLGWGGLVSGDADGDGLADAVVGGPEGAHVLLGPLSGEVDVATGTWLHALEPDAGSRFAVTLVPDRDGDEAGELVLSTADRVWVLPVTGGGVFEATDGHELWSGSGYDAPAVLGADLDGDGSGDIVIGDPAASYADRWQSGLAYVLWGP